ncbi:MAG TPA: replication-relaxation family protein [Candidatus Saccharimonadales bacterium]|nr:replication-relaxation family protein [Candidatus Saccharimonadales bacterium]
MNTNTAKYRLPLNNNQTQVLELLYKFRFGSSDIIARYFDKPSGAFVFKRMKILEEQGYVAKRYDGSYRIQGKPAAYYLLPEGARKLQEDKKVQESTARIKAIYKDKTVSEQFIQECLDIFDIYITLRSHNSGIKFFTKAYLGHEDYDYFPHPLPDAYMKLQDGKHYFLQVHHEHQPFFVATRAVKRYLDYFENGAWDDTGTDFPVLLFIVDSSLVQNRVHKLLRKQTNGLKAYTALKDDIMNNADGRVWRDADEPDDVYSLDQLKSLEAVE